MDDMTRRRGFVTSAGVDRRPRRRGWKAPAVVLISFAVLATLSAGAGADSGSPQNVVRVDTTDTTLPGGNHVDADLLEAPEVVDMAEQLGISREEAVALFDGQGKQGLYVDSVYSHPGFVDYRGPFSEGALLVVEPGYEESEPFLSAPGGLEIRAAPTSADKRAAAHLEAEAAAREVAGSNFISVAYDVFENSYTVWVESGSLSAALETDLKTTVASELRSNATASVKAREAEDWSDARGGAEILVNGDLVCTTAYGVVDWPVFGYLTAGHCPLGGAPSTITINGNVATSVQSVANGGYQDRAVIVAPNASYWVRVTPGQTVDMDLRQNKHIFLGVWYNHWGQGTDTNDGGTIFAINVPCGSTNNRWCSATSAQCGSGDSGGPVYKWIAGERYPKGLISAAALLPGGFTAPCGYVALDDQLAGTAWSLL